MTINFVTQLIVDALAIKYVDKIGQRMSVVMAHFFAAIGMISLAILPRVLPSPYLGLILACILFSIGAVLLKCLLALSLRVCRRCESIFNEPTTLIL